MALYDLEKDRAKVRNLVKSDNFNHLIMFLILFDSVILGLLTSGFVRVSIGFELFLLDRLIVALFISEMLMKIYAFKGGFFKKGWNIIDLSVVVLSIIPATSYFVVLRSVRLLRLVKYIDDDIKITQFLNALGATLQPLLTALASYAFVLYVFSIIAVGSFGDEFIEFSSLSSSMFIMLQMVMLDNVATDVVRFTMQMYPHSWILFYAYIMVSYLVAMTFVILSAKAIFNKK